MDSKIRDLIMKDCKVYLEGSSDLTLLINTNPPSFKYYLIISKENTLIAVGGRIGANPRVFGSQSLSNRDRLISQKLKGGYVKVPLGPANLYIQLDVDFVDQILEAM